MLRLEGVVVEVDVLLVRNMRAMKFVGTSWKDVASMVTNAHSFTNALPERFLCAMSTAIRDTAAEKTVNSVMNCHLHADIISAAFASVVLNVIVGTKVQEKLTSLVCSIFLVSAREDLFARKRSLSSSFFNT